MNPLNPTRERRRQFTSIPFLLVVIAIVGLVGGGCVTPIPGASKNLLAFLQEGKTTREQVIMALGQPSGTFEKETIVAYRIGHDRRQGYFIVSPKQTMPWAFVRYSLVLLFDENGVLREHKLVNVQ